MKPNTIRDRGLKACAGQEEAARAAWKGLVAKFPHAGPDRVRTARLAMLTVLSKGGTLAAGKSAARKVLA